MTPYSAVKYEDVTLRTIIERPYQEVFGPIRDNAPGSFCSPYSRTPKIAATARKSPRRRQKPHPKQPVEYKISPGLWQSVKAVWDFYQKRPSVAQDASLLDLSFSNDSLLKFLQPLGEVFNENNFCYDWIESLLYAEDLIRLDTLWFDLPCIPWDGEETEFYEGLFFSPASFGQVLQATFEQADLEQCLSKESRALVERVGLSVAAEVYAEANDSEKVLELKQFSEFPGLYKTVNDKYPDLMEKYCPVTIGDSPTQVEFVDKDHIDFAIEFTKCFTNILDMAPDPWAILEGGDEAIALVEDMCRVYRENKDDKGGKNLADAA
ncbi:hypothetical protein [Geoalkalibacter subterraneus]|uniref:Uncharacterized protein n=1 Tax=Geoalkalibacter subterraneus TaxID=483547 RepID=A0A0B5FJE2_9BACT|nr:hypothetical protein [Geoalkalibacter subterraneus]AJF08287.1 hypothetical protein GSUB_17580 [Geoalkalibacter subterraneus]